MRIALTLALIAAAGTAMAETQALVAKAIGNTIVSTYPDGRTGEIWLQADGTYTGMGRKKTDPSSGHWRIKGDSICLKQSRPFPAPFSFCVKVPQSGFDSGFQSKAYTGEMTTVTLLNGHVMP